VSINVWGRACAGAISLVSEGCFALWSLRSGVVKTGPRKGEVIKMEALGAGIGKGGGVGGKKEL